MAKYTHKKKTHLKGINSSKNSVSRKYVKPVKKRKSGKGKLILGIIGLVLIGILIYLMVNVFQLPAKYPVSYAINEMTISDSKVTMKASTDTYGNKLIPLDFFIALGGGQLKEINEKEKSIVFNNGTEMVIEEGSKRVAINSQKKKYNGPVMTVGERIWVPGQLLEVTFGSKASFVDNIAIFNIKENKKEDKFFKFTGSEGYLSLVNNDNFLSKDFVPSDLVDVNSLNSIGAYGGNTKLCKKAANALVKMYEDSNVNMILSSGFRDYQNQEELFNQEVADSVANGLSKEDATKEARTRVATPGMSEHQLGLAADFAIPGELLSEDFKNTIAGKWLNKNSYKYGFILRYPEEKKNITNVIYEPWHFRYIGLPHSEIVAKKNITYDEYIGNLRKDRTLTYEAEDKNQYGIWYFKENEKPDNIQYTGNNDVDVSTDNGKGVIVTIPLSQIK